VQGTGQAQRAPRWLADGILILVSAAVGFGAAQFGEYRNDRELAGRTLAGLRAELEHNLSQLDPIVPVHQEWVAALRNADSAAEGNQSALDVYFAVRPEMPPNTSSPFPFLRRSAWDAAVAGGTLRLIDYDVTAALSEIYLVQEIVRDNVNRLAQGALSSAATFDPRSRGPATRLLWLTLADIAAAEAMLLDRYREHLPLIQKAVAKFAE
jgi:hypothetical protein